MTKKLKALMLQLSELREVANEAADDQRPAALAKLKAAELEYREALAVEPDGVTADPLTVDQHGAMSTEQRERAEVRARVARGAWIRAAIRGVPVDGAEAEYAAAVGCVGAMPLDIFEAARRGA